MCVFLGNFNRKTKERMSNGTKNITKETAKVFDTAKEAWKKYPCPTINKYHLIYAILDDESCLAYQIISKSTLRTTINNMKEWYRQRLEAINQETSDPCDSFDSLINKCIDYSIDKLFAQSATSAHILASLIAIDQETKERMSVIGITYEGVLSFVGQYSTPQGNAQRGKRQLAGGNAVEDNLIDLTDMACKGLIDEVYGNDDIIADIFRSLSKRDKNNVVVVGDAGVGKTATVKHIANLLCDGKVPSPFKSKKLMQVDFNSLLTGTAYRGNLEAKLKSIVSDAVSSGKYIFFIDDIHTLFGDKSKYGDMSAEDMVNMFLNEREIMLVCTTSHNGYSRWLSSSQPVSRRMRKITMREKDESESVDILKRVKERYEKFHHVKFDDETIALSVSLSKRYLDNTFLPDSAIDVMDDAAAAVKLANDNDDELLAYRTEMDDVKLRKSRLSRTLSGDKDEYDTLSLREMELNGRIAAAEKRTAFKLMDRPPCVGVDDIREIVSRKSGIPVTDITEDDSHRLRGIDSRLKKYIVGQDEAIDEVCRVFKRQRVGLSRDEKPTVLFFGGSTGTGKTYLSKLIAKEVFGDEKCLVRLDMGEYSDKMSVSKLSGSAPGYIGYENGGVLTEAVKKNKYCVVLLDEIEKASDEVHDAFLHIFDDGRMTDNTGMTVDFSNVIVVMTSNVGASELSESSKRLGFVKSGEDATREIVNRSIKRKFKPEFINRIDAIIYFNKLSDENLKSIIRMELHNVGERLSRHGYSLSDDVMGDTIVNAIYDKVRCEPEYGARPIDRVIQHEIEDKLADHIIDKRPPKGHVFDADFFV
ncbi:MAG: ATP-dependent Clp protease ATP-binding subunit [Paludibacteraceae bacterium]|nr:ATP-dependent Clp protease ATP-binding subunit [Paludibacteraceae bacterium]